MSRRAAAPADDAPDLAILIAASYRATIERLLRQMARGGITGMRSAYGFVIRAVAAEEPSIGRLAELLDTTKQAASKLSELMVHEGFLVRFIDKADARRTRLRLTAKGRRVIQTAVATGDAMERELTARLGSRDVAAFRRVLLTLLERNGGLDDVLARRARPVW